MKLMIIDNTAEARAAIRKSVGAVACEICELPSAEEAIQQCDRLRPDCLIIGARLDGMSGYSAMRLFRVLSPQTRMIVVTEADSAAVRRLARAAGACHLVARNNLHALSRYVGAIDRDRAARAPGHKPRQDAAAGLTDACATQE